MDRARTILHVDLDAFYASVEQRDDATLRGRPVIVAGPAPRGVVSAASYEARPFGVRSAMPTSQAIALCPGVVVVAPRMGHYAAVSDAFFGILGRYSPLVEGLSLDEAFLDCTGEEKLLGDGPTIARRIKDDVRAELSIVASVGVAPSKYVAKVASDLGKPDGLLVVDEARVADFLRPLPVGRLWGVGRVTEAELASLGLRTISDLIAVGEERLGPRLGRDRARHLLALCRGEDTRPVEPERAAVSVGSEDTFERDHHDRESLRPHLLSQSDQVCARLRHMGRRAHTVTIKIKYGNHQSITRRVTLARATSDGRVVGREALRLLEGVPAIAERGVRLTGVSLSGLSSERDPQLSLDEADAARGEQLDSAIDQITAKFGRGTVRRAVHLGGNDARGIIRSGFHDPKQKPPAKGE